MSIYSILCIGAGTEVLLPEQFLETIIRGTYGFNLPRFTVKIVCLYATFLQHGCLSHQYAYNFIASLAKSGYHFFITEKTKMRFNGKSSAALTFNSCHCLKNINKHWCKLESLWCYELWFSIQIQYPVIWQYILSYCVGVWSMLAFDC